MKNILGARVGDLERAAMQALLRLGLARSLTCRKVRKSNVNDDKFTLKRCNVRMLCWHRLMASPCIALEVLLQESRYCRSTLCQSCLRYILHH